MFSSEGHLAERRAAAFDLVKKLVADNYESQRRSFGASLKPELLRRTAEGFSESDLGFSSFAAFMEAAASAGVVDLHVPPRGPDREATPPGFPPLTPSSGTADPVPPTETPGVKAPVSLVPDRSEEDSELPRGMRVRPDLWAAFVDWDGRVTRIYDRESEQAVMLPRDPTTFEPAHVAEIRDALKVQSERFVQIEPIGFQEQLDWMREFTETANSTVTQEALVTALEDGRPARAFAQVLHTDDVERARWNRFRTSRVLERMAAWGTKAGVTLQPFVSVQISRTGLTRGQAVSPASRTQHHAPALQPQSPGPLQQDRAHRLRARLHAAIDRMPESELLTLRLPVEYLIEP